MSTHRPLAITAAALAPLLICAVLVPFRTDFANTSAALALVLVVVASAMTGVRPAGYTAAVSGAVWFDFFLTRPYQNLHIDDRNDIETAVLLVLVGAAVTELALWGRRRQAEASNQEGYLTGIADSAARAAAGEPVVDTVAAQLVTVLGADECRWAGTARRDLPTLRRDGSVVRGDRVLDVDRHGLPTDAELDVPAGDGHLLVTAATRISRPSLTQRRVAVLLADQVAARHRHSPLTVSCCRGGGEGG